MIDNNEISQTIKIYRKMLYMTQVELADKVGISVSTLAKYESGKSVPRYDIIKKLAGALDIPVTHLLKSDDALDEYNVNYAKRLNLMYIGKSTVTEDYFFVDSDYISSPYFNDTSMANIPFMVFCVKYADVVSVFMKSSDFLDEFVNLCLMNYNQPCFLCIRKNKKYINYLTNEEIDGKPISIGVQLISNIDKFDILKREYE